MGNDYTLALELDYEVFCFKVKVFPRMQECFIRKKDNERKPCFKIQLYGGLVR